MFDGLYHPFMLIRGMVYYCYAHISCWRQTPFFPTPQHVSTRIYHFRYHTYSYMKGMLGIMMLDVRYNSHAVQQKNELNHGMHPGEMWLVRRIRQEPAIVLSCVTLSCVTRKVV